MARVFCYIVAASGNPDNIGCAVPYKVDDGEIFYGPCKKLLREWLRHRYLGEATESADPADDVYVVGFNGYNPSKTRKIVWIGKLIRVMTFRSAHHALDGSRYERMRKARHSPLHVEPIVRDGRFRGYSHRSQMHSKNNNWVTDLVKSRQSPDVTLSGRRLVLRPGVSAWRGFPRDVCALFENIFFAAGRGRDIDDDLLAILQAAQLGRNVDRYAVFGYRRDGTADGRTGNHLELTGGHARACVDWIQGTPSAPPPGSGKARPTVTTASGKC
ncbi:MAG: hypothetical protein OXN97_05270 [Bryobacterales bacterium]|nr:hypothetical protein [Bryobacterales bacterium]